MEFKILYEDESIIAVFKPAGIASQTSKITEKDLFTSVRSYLSEKNNKNTMLWLVHRLDQPVKGIVVFAKNEKAAANLTGQIQSGEMHKYYYALLQGELPENNIEDKNVELVNYMYKDSKNNKAVILEDSKGKTAAKSDKNVKKAVLKYKVIKADKEYNRTLVEIELITGRFHQIRAQMSNLGNPILLDEKYGYSKEKDIDYENVVDKGQIALCAARVDFLHPVNKKRMSVKVFENEPVTVDFLCKC